MTHSWGPGDTSGPSGWRVRDPDPVSAEEDTRCNRTMFPLALSLAVKSEVKGHLQDLR